MYNLWPYDILFLLGNRLEEFQQLNFAAYVLLPSHL